MKKMLKRSAVLAAGLLALSCSSVGAETLPEAVQFMLNSNPNIRSIAHNRLARDQEVKQAEAAYWPKIDFTYGVGAHKQYEPTNASLSQKLNTLSFRQNLFNGFATVGEVDRQEARVKSAAYKIQGTSEEYALAAASVYLDVLRHKELNSIAKENLTIHERIHDQIKLRSESGVSNKSNEDQVSGRLSLAQTNSVIAEINIQDAETNYHAIIGHAPKDLSSPKSLDSFVPASLETAQKKAVDSHPTLKSADADLEARKAQDEVAKAPFWPVVDVEVDRNWDTNYDTTNMTEGYRENMSALLRVRYNIFNGFKHKARKAETLELINEAREIKNNTHRQVVESIRLSWMAYDAAKRKVDLLGKYVDSSTATAEAFSKQWSLGKRTMLDVLDTEAEVINAKQDLVNAKYDKLYAQYRILSGMGELLKDLNMQAPPEGVMPPPPAPKKAPLATSSNRLDAILAAEKAGIDTSNSWTTVSPAGAKSTHSPVRSGEKESLMKNKSSAAPVEGKEATATASSKKELMKLSSSATRQQAVDAAKKAGIDTSQSWSTINENGQKVTHSAVK